MSVSVCLCLCVCLGDMTVPYYIYLFLMITIGLRQGVGQRFCLPHELQHGRWEPVQDSIEWRLYSSCNFTTWTSSAALGEMLQARNATIIFSGNSIIRHIFFRLGELLHGSINYGTKINAASFGGTKLNGVLFDRYNRDVEKKLCSKTHEPPANFSAYQVECIRGTSGCGCGACSCMHTEQNVTQIFVWQQKLFDDHTKNSWDVLIRKEKESGKRVFLLFNAGLVQAMEESYESLPNITAQGDLLRQYLEKLPDHVVPIYLQSGATMPHHVDNVLAAQDGLLQAIFSSFMPHIRPLVLNPRMLTQYFIDFIDNSHFGGRTADVFIDMIMHVIRHYDELFDPNNISAVGTKYQYENSNLCEKAEASVASCQSTADARPVRNGDVVATKPTGKSIFLVQNNTLRSFPNYGTFVNMGFTTASIKHVPSTGMAYGAPLPPK